MDTLTKDTLVAYFNKFPKDILIEMMIASNVIQVVSPNKNEVTVDVKYLLDDPEDSGVKEIKMVRCAYCHWDPVNCLGNCTICNTRGCSTQSMIGIYTQGGYHAAHTHCASNAGYLRCSGNDNRDKNRCYCESNKHAYCPIHCAAYTDMKCPQGHPICQRCQDMCALCNNK